MATAGQSGNAADAGAETEGVSMFDLGIVVLRNRRSIFVFGVIGFALGLTAALTTPLTYVSTARFLPQSSEQEATGLALAASQFGIRVPTTGSGWGPPVYVELLRSRALLEPIALDTLVVREEGIGRTTIVDLLGVPPADRERRSELAVRALSRLVTANEITSLAAVELRVRTRWPTVSYEIADRLIRGVNQFNLQTRRSQAAAERQFVEGQVQDAEAALRAAEDELQTFLTHNRIIEAPELSFQRDRLQREILFRQQVYTSLVESREDAKIREVRDTPVITVIDSPRTPIVPESRGRLQKLVVGTLAGLMIGVLLGFVRHASMVARRSTSGRSREFFDLVEQTTPSFFKRFLRS